MAKYIDAEKIRAEIERRKKYTHDWLRGDEKRHPKQTSVSKNYYKMKGDERTLDALLNFLDSLQQEQPDNEDVDKVAQELYEHLYELKRRNNVPTNLYDKQEIIDLWKAGIVYGRSHPKQEQPEVECEDLEKEIHEKAIQLHTAPTYEELDRFARHFFDLGLKARKED